MDIDLITTLIATTVAFIIVRVLVEKLIYRIKYPYTWQCPKCNDFKLSTNNEFMFLEVKLNHIDNCRSDQPV